MVEVGRDLGRLCSQEFLLKEGHLELIADDCVQVGFVYLHRRRPQNFSGQPQTVTIKK